MINKITCREMYQWRVEEKDFTVVDVLTPEDYAVKRIPGSVNACVYEMTFLEQIRNIASDKDRCIVVYDSSIRSKASVCAAQKLIDGGFEQVFELVGGIEEWEGSGYPMDVLGVEIDEESVVPDGVYSIDCGKSMLEWAIRTASKKHWGTIDISGGEIVVKNGIIASGFATVDMRTIKDNDLFDQEQNSQLVRRIVSDDFFGVEGFPTAKIEILQCKVEQGATPGSPNCLVSAMLTIKGVEKEISFPSIVVPGKDGGLQLQACLDVDRTEWNIVYGSGKIFEKLGNHLINDIISFELYITAK